MQKQMQIQSTKLDNYYFIAISLHPFLRSDIFGLKNPTAVSATPLFAHS